MHLLTAAQLAILPTDSLPTRLANEVQSECTNNCKLSQQGEVVARCYNTNPKPLALHFHILILFQGLDCLWVIMRNSVVSRM